LTFGIPRPLQISHIRVWICSANNSVPGHSWTSPFYRWPSRLRPFVRPFASVVFSRTENTTETNGRLGASSILLVCPLHPWLSRPHPFASCLVLSHFHRPSPARCRPQASPSADRPLGDCQSLSSTLGALARAQVTYRS
jgi:hypothetical protein